MNELPSAPFEAAHAVKLAHALCAYVARTNEIRCLAIKGFTLEFFELRPPRTYADADVWVDPREFARFISAMEERGWRERYVRYVPHVLSPHSKTLIHPEWPCDIDVHWYFPGPIEDEITVFDLMWKNRCSMSVASACVLATNAEASAFVGLLHCAREAGSPQHQREANAILSKVGSWPEKKIQALRALFTDTSSISALTDSMRLALGLSKPTDSESRAFEDQWRLHLDSLANGSTLAWIRAVARAKHGRFRVLWRAAYPTRKEIALQRGRNVSPMEAFTIRFVRVGKAIKVLPAVVRALFRHRMRNKGKA